MRLQDPDSPTFYFYCDFCNHNTATRSGKHTHTHTRTVVNLDQCGRLKKRGMPHVHIQDAENRCTREPLIAALNWSRNSLPCVVVLSLSLSPSQCQNDEDARGPHSVLHPADSERRERTRRGRRESRGVERRRVLRRGRAGRREVMGELRMGKVNRCEDRRLFDAGLATLIAPCALTCSQKQRMYPPQSTACLLCSSSEFNGSNGTYGKCFCRSDAVNDLSSALATRQLYLSLLSLHFLWRYSLSPEDESWRP